MRAFVVALLFAALMPFGAQAQSDGTMPADGTAPPDPGSVQSAGTVTDPKDPGSVPVSSESSAPAAATPVSSSTPGRPPAPKPSSAVAPSPQSSPPAQAPATDLPAPAQESTGSITSVLPGAESSGAASWLWPILAVLALLPFGFVLAQYLKREPKGDGESKKRCFDIERMVQEKLDELTDVKAMLKEKGIEMGKEKMRDMVSGTAAGDLLVRAEKLEEQYGKLKKLLEECKTDIDRYRYKGVLIENSLLDKAVLEHVRIIRTRKEGAWTLHDIRLSKKQIEEVQKSIVDSKWYFHLWEPGKDVVTVVFKDALFEIKHSDRSTWHEAVAYGLAHGIPEEQLDFPIIA